MSKIRQNSVPWTRTASLLAILLLVGGAMLNDQFNKVPRSAVLIEEVNKLIEAETDDGHGISSDLVQRTLKMRPAATFKVKAYDVEEYDFRRTVPFFSLRKLFVVYYQNGVATFFEGDTCPTEKMIKRKMGKDFVGERE
jgi:hypothetical protein